MTLLILAILGLSMGSFAMALVWRIHKGKNFVNDRSECEFCGHKLEPLDLIPVFSWFALKGKCRYCHNKLSWQYPLSEIAMALLFAGSFVFWPEHFLTWQTYVHFGIWLAYLLLLFALFVYDIKWMLLPNILVFPLIGLGLVDVILSSLDTYGSHFLIPFIQFIAFGGLTLGGFYWLLYTISRGAWVGYGDVKLGLFMGIALGWQGALAVLFLSNIIGFLFIAPAMLAGKLNRKSRVPFGPFLIAAFIIVGLFGKQLLFAYLSFALGR